MKQAASAAFSIAGRVIGPGSTYVVAELSANHNGSLEKALQLVRAAKDTGADAVKVQTFTADSITLDCDNPHFCVEGTAWAGRNLHDLYREAALPWDWHEPLQRAAQDVGLTFFSTPFSPEAVDFLQSLRVPVFKIASCELVDIPLLRAVARTSKPVIASTGMASLAEIDEAVTTLRDGGCGDLALLKCTTAYPADASEANLATIAHLADGFGVPVGLSDHTMDVTVPALAVAAGAVIIEKHMTLSRRDAGPDSGFSIEPGEFKSMVQAIRLAEKALGKVHYGPTASEQQSLRYRRSLFVVEDVAAGEVLTAKNVRSIRPALGMHPRYFDVVLGRRAKCAIQRGTPLSWDLIA